MKTSEELRRIEWEEDRPTPNCGPERFLLIADLVERDWDIWERSSWDVEWRRVSAEDEQRLCQQLAVHLGCQRPDLNARQRPVLGKRCPKRWAERLGPKHRVCNHNCLVATRARGQHYRPRSSLPSANRAPVCDGDNETVQTSGEAEEESKQEEDTRHRNCSTLRNGSH